MRSQEQTFRAYYASMPDAQLLQVAANERSFLAIAQRSLEAELAKRGLALPATPAPPFRHSIFGDHLAKWARRLHHHPAAP